MSGSNIIVSAAACRTSGAKTIYLQFLKHLKEHAAKNHYYVFIDESMPHEDIPGVEYFIVNVRNGCRRVFSITITAKESLNIGISHQRLSCRYKILGWRV